MFWGYTNDVNTHITHIRCSWVVHLIVHLSWSSAPLAEGFLSWRTRYARAASNGLAARHAGRFKSACAAGRCAVCRGSDCEGGDCVMSDCASEGFSETDGEMFLCQTAFCALLRSYIIYLELKCYHWLPVKIYMYFNGSYVFMLALSGQNAYPGIPVGCQTEVSTPLMVWSL